MRFKTPEEDLAEKCPSRSIHITSQKSTLCMTAVSDLQTLNVLVQVFATKYDFAVSNNKRHRHNIAQRKLLR